MLLCTYLLTILLQGRPCIVCCFRVWIANTQIEYTRYFYILQVSKESRLNNIFKRLKTCMVYFHMVWFFCLSERHRNDVKNLTLLSKCRILFSSVKFFDVISTSLQRVEKSSKWIFHSITFMIRPVPDICDLGLLILMYA